MPDNIVNVEMQANEWIDLYAETGITVGTAIAVENIGVCDVYLAVSAAQPTKPHEAYNVLIRDKEVLRNNEGDAGAWAYCREGAKVRVTTPAQEGFTPMSNVRLYDGFGNPISSLDGALDVHDADVHRVPINELFHRHTGVDTTLAIAASQGDTTITVVDGTLFNNNDPIQIEDAGIIEVTFPSIISGGGTNIFVLDRPLDRDFPIGALVEVVETNIATAAGTLLAPVSFKLIPDDDQVWHIVRFLLGLVHNSPADDSKFGSLPALTNGCVLRAFNGATGQFRTFTNWKSNADIKMDMFDLNYTDKSGAGDFGTNGRGSIKIGTGAAPRIDSASGDYIELLVQDDLTVAGELIIFNLKGQGHKEGI